MLTEALSKREILAPRKLGEKAYHAIEAIKFYLIQDEDYKKVAAARTFIRKEELSPEIRFRPQGSSNDYTRTYTERTVAGATRDEAPYTHYQLTIQELSIDGEPKKTWALSTRFRGDPEKPDEIEFTDGSITVPNAPANSRQAFDELPLQFP